MYGINRAALGAIAMVLAGAALAAPVRAATLSPAEKAQVQAIADRLRKGAQKSPEEYSKVLLDIWSEDGAALKHDPAFPSDTTLSKATIAKGQQGKDALFRKAIPDYAYKNVDTRVLGDRIYLSYDQVGTMPDKSRLFSTIVTRMTIRDGKMVEAVVAVDPEQAAPMMALQRSMAARK
ncbi:MAG: hypothetical protein JWQ29_377 [Phenylobacterium sp.]|nr:hypothetical protein [Phenylobacterium sp.]